VTREAVVGDHRFWGKLLLWSVADAIDPHVLRWAKST
jgi:hypothetical protein